MPHVDQLDSIRPVTADGQALKEICLILYALEGAPDFIQEGTLGYLKSRYRVPSYILTADDVANEVALSEALTQS